MHAWKRMKKTWKPGVVKAACGLARANISHLNTLLTVLANKRCKAANHACLVALSCCLGARRTLHPPVVEVADRRFAAHGVEQGRAESPPC